MTLILQIVAAALTIIGAVTLYWGTSPSLLSLGNTVMVVGAVIAASGIVLFGLSAVMGQLGLLADKLDELRWALEGSRVAAPVHVDAAPEVQEEPAPAPRVEPQALQRLIDYAWPGNVRELRNVVERLLVFADGDRIDAARVDALLHPGARTVASTGRTGFERIVPLAEMEQAYLRWVVDKLDGNVSAAATRLGIARSTIYRLLRPHADEGARP